MGGIDILSNKISFLKREKYKIGFALLVIVLLITTGFLVLYNPSNIPIDLADVNNPPNILLFIGDGMGPEHLQIASLVEHGAFNETIFFKAFPTIFKVDTTNIFGLITDSAASATAMSTGHLTANRRIAMDSTGTKSLETILEKLTLEANYSAGLVTTTEFTHATPAAFAAHVPDRGQIEEIFNQMLSNNVDLILGGGVNLSWMDKNANISAVGAQHGFSVATNLDELEHLVNDSTRLLGVFGNGHMPYEIYRNTSLYPSIVEMTSIAIEFLNKKNKPFFLMVEGGRIDHASHANNLTLAIIETIMFEMAVRIGLEFASQDNNTIVIVTSDHETGGLTLLDHSNLDNELPKKGYSREENLTIIARRTRSLSATWETTGHTNRQVYFFGNKKTLEYYPVENINDVYYSMLFALTDSLKHSNNHALASDEAMLMVLPMRRERMDVQVFQASFIIFRGRYA